MPTATIYPSASNYLSQLVPVQSASLPTSHYAENVYRINMGLPKLSAVTEPEKFGLTSASKVPAINLLNTLQGTANKRNQELTDLLNAGVVNEQNLLTSTLGSLGTQRQSYAQQLTGQLAGQQSALQKARQDYITQQRAQAEADKATQMGELTGYTAAERAAADRAIAESDRAVKSMLAKTGGGESSYMSRLMAGTRAGLETGLAQKIADRRRQILEQDAARRLALETTAAERERQDLATIYADRLGTIRELGGLERGDIGLGYTGQERIYTNDLARRLAQYQNLTAQERADLNMLIQAGAIQTT